MLGPLEFLIQWVLGRFTGHANVTRSGTTLWEPFTQSILALCIMYFHNPMDLSSKHFPIWNFTCFCVITWLTHLSSSVDCKFLERRVIVVTSLPWHKGGSSINTFWINKRWITANSMKENMLEKTKMTTFQTKRVSNELLPADSYLLRPQSQRRSKVMTDHKFLDLDHPNYPYPGDWSSPAMR